MEIANKENFRKEVKRLTEQFSSNKEYYESSKYKEDQLRQEFINPFFNALGWDMDNKQGFAPQYREVIHEDRIEIEGKPKAPDYAFKVGSDRKFFVEAKACSVRVFTETEPAFQLRRYAWSSSLPVSILTDFEEFSVYDTTLEPKQKNKASVARVKYMRYEDYLKEIDYLWDTFSKEAVWKGSFDKFATKEKKGSQLVDKSFLKEIESWRELLAKDIASHNDLDLYDLNFVVQKLIDRLIFLRIAEDRGIENYETLRKTIESSETYSELLKVFKRADDKYDSSLFDFKTDELSTTIKVSDNVLDRILGNLYYPKSPYEFSVIGVDILGSVYEQFLGKVIRLTRGGNAVIEEKPEVKKAGGVYYTPQYIVEYIVNNTVGELVKGKTPKEVAKLKIVDPACGSGSFLIGAYNYLLDWHLKYYIENDPEKHVKSKKLFKDSGGNYYLSSQEKKEILLNNIYGVDIDTQAVAVTKLSLSLKMLEDENSETIGAQFILFAERILPDLRDNIKCGNSLIGSDYYSDRQISLLDDEEIRKVNVFDWDKEFPLVFRYGGFDAVIGNPPYVGMEGMDPELRNYTYGRGNYLTAVRKTNLYAIFMEKGISILRPLGILGFITPYSWISNSSYKELREIIFKKTSLLRFILFPYGIFENAGISTSISLVRNKTPEEHHQIEVVDLSLEDLIGIPSKLTEHNNENQSAIPLKSVLKDSNYIFNVNYKEDSDGILKKLCQNSVELGEITKIDRGCDTANNEKYISTIKESTKNPKPFLEGTDFSRWGIKWSGKYLNYLPSQMKEEKKTARPGTSKRFEQKEKLIIYRFLQNDGGMKATYDNESYYTLGSTYVLRVTDNRYEKEIKSILGILNSRLISYYIKQKFKGVKITQTELASIPIPDNTKIRNSKVKTIVNELLKIEYHKQKEKGFKKELLNKQINTLENGLKKEIYSLYGLTKKEVEEIESEL